MSFICIGATRCIAGANLAGAMANPVPPDSETVEAARLAIRRHGVYGASRLIGLHHNTLQKVAKGAPVAPSTIRSIHDAGLVKWLPISSATAIGSQ